MSLTYAGYPLLLPDTAGELSEWQERFQSARMYGHQSKSVALQSNRATQSRYDNSFGVGLSVPNYPDPPEPRINTLYWPCTGATRWARGYFLCSEETLPKIMAATGKFANPATLSISKIKGGSLRPKMYCLPPMPITMPGAGAINTGLWLLPLVDRRYYSQLSNVVKLDTANVADWTWFGIYQHLTSNTLGFAAIIAAPNAAYKTPDKTEFTRRYDNGAVLIDAALASICQRFVQKINGSPFAAETATNALKELYARTTKLKYGIAGGNANDAFGPESIEVIFPKIKNGVPLLTGEVYAKLNKLKGSNLFKASSIFTIHSSMFADFTTGGATPDNAADVDGLATEITKDLKAWFNITPYDITVAGVADVEACGADDSIYIQFGAQRQSANGEWEYEATTRIKSLPVNFGWDTNLSQNIVAKQVHWVRAKVYDADIATNATGSVEPWDQATTAYLTGASRINISTDGCQPLFKNQIIKIHWNADENEWQVAEIESRVHKCKVTVAASKGGPGTVRRYDSVDVVIALDIAVISKCRAIAVGEWVFIAWSEGAWVVVESEGGGGGGNPVIRCKVFDETIFPNSAVGGVEPWDQAAGVYLTGAAMIQVSTYGIQPLFKGQVIHVIFIDDEVRYRVIEVESRVLKCKATSLIPRGGVGTCQRYGNGDVLIPYSIAARSKCVSVQNGKWCMIAWMEDEWHVVEVEASCEVPVTVVTSISFDSATCTFTFCTRDLCLPEGTTVSAADCGAPAQQAAVFLVQFPRIGGPDAAIVEL